MKNKKIRTKRKSGFSASERRAFWIGYGSGYSSSNQYGFPSILKNNTQKEDESYFSGHKKGSAEGFVDKNKHR